MGEGGRILVILDGRRAGVERESRRMPRAGKRKMLVELCRQRAKDVSKIRRAASGSKRGGGGDG